jgi:nitrate reductase NapE component
MPAVDRLFGFDEPTQFMTETLWQRLWQLVTDNGVYMESSSSLAVVPTSPPSMNVVVQPGAAWVGGAYAEVTTAKTLAIAAAPASGTRMDRVVLRRNNATNSIQLDVVQGVASSSPSPPSLTRAGDIYEISLATIVIPAGTTAIGASNIIDERPDPQLCGHVTPGAPRGYTSRLVGGLAAVNLANGDNNNVAVPNATIIRVTGPTAPFAITGLTGGEAGRVLILFNDTNKAMTIRHESVASAAANRIITPTGSDIVPKAALLTYDGTAQRWRVLDVAVGGGSGGTTSMTVSLPTTVNNYVEIMGLPADTAVRMVVSVPDLGITKAYQFQTLNSTFSGVWHAPPAAMAAADVTANDVVLEMTWDSTNNLAVLRLRRRAGTTAATAYITVETAGTITPRSGTGTSGATSLWPKALRGWQLVGRAFPSINVSAVSFQGLYVTREGALQLIIRGRNAQTVETSLSVRVNGETDDTSWQGREFSVTGTTTPLTTNARYSASGLIAYVEASAQFAAVSYIMLATGLVFVVSQAATGGYGRIAWASRSGAISEITRVDVVTPNTGIAGGSVLELYQLLER